MNITTRVKRRTHISTGLRVPVWRPSAGGYALARAHRALRLIDAARERPMYYLLMPDHSVKPIWDTLEWARSFERESRFLASTDVGGWRVSTVFLGLDHAFMDGPPLIFETMVFTAATKDVEIFGRMRSYHQEVNQRRYSTYEQAMQGHEECVAETRAVVAGMNRLTGPPDDA